MFKCMHCISSLNLLINFFSKDNTKHFNSKTKIQNADMDKVKKKVITLFIVYYLFKLNALHSGSVSVCIMPPGKI